VSVGHSVEATGWVAESDRLLARMAAGNRAARMAARFPRVETRRRAAAFVRGLLADLPRKNCWTIAEHAGDRDPHGMQHLLARASGTPTEYAMTCATTSWAHSPTPTPCWWWTYADTATMPSCAVRAQCPRRSVVRGSA